MGFRYAVIGAGRQGTAAAFDLATHGGADAVVLADVNLNAAKSAAKRVNKLAVTTMATAAKVDVTKPDSVLKVLRKADVFISGVPYYFNPRIAKLAVRAKASMVDFGGKTDLAREQLKLDGAAKKAGIAIVPECGLGPGANLTLAVHAMSLLDEAEDVRIYDGGLPQKPVAPWDYELVFNIEGLTNEYAGTATFLRDGKRVEVPALSAPEDVVVPPIGTLEARVTTGGLSTMPWTFEGKLRTLELKTLRYPGHWARIEALADLGMFSEKPVAVKGAKVVPRDVFHALFGPKVTNPNVRDYAISRAVARGWRNGRRAQAVVEMLDRFDPATGFRAMERTTGWHASIVAAMIARGEIPPGAHSVETGVPPKRFVEEASKRGLSITETVR
ncbi:MAG TPA: saccharopine dehydrogenase C-terminal domain-containing protein [Thermoplasmata archaeon]|nr:saccharopine dehydrogenase C-terminal domain-containing protein [Thermoplasmata archaeon]